MSCFRFATANHASATIAFIPMTAPSLTRAPAVKHSRAAGGAHDRLAAVSFVRSERGQQLSRRSFCDRRIVSGAMTITDLLARIDQRLADVDTEVADLTRARDALLEVQGRETATSPRPAAKSAATTKPGRRRRARTKRRYEVLTTGTLISLLAGSEGMSTREVAHATNGDPAQVLALLKEQEDAGLVRRSGARAATRWHVISDEDRIAARAAELEASNRLPRVRRS